MPDLFYLESICDSLNVSVNELISGEFLSKEAYCDKAEENIMALMKENQQAKKGNVVSIVLGVLFILLAMFLTLASAEYGWMQMLLSYFDLSFPRVVNKTLSSIASLTTPLALLVIGAGFEGRKAIKKIRPTILATTIKLIIQPMIFLPLAVYLNFSADKLIAALIMLGAPTTATSYMMAKNMNHEGTLSSSIVVLTTLMSAFTITFWIFILKSLNYI